MISFYIVQSIFIKNQEINKETSQIENIKIIYNVVINLQ